MVEPIGIASGLLALATFAFQSSVSLYQAVSNFQSNKRTIRELKEELEALEAVLKSLEEATAHNAADLPALKLPLLRCGQGLPGVRGTNRQMHNPFRWIKDQYSGLGEANVHGGRYCWIQEHVSWI